MTQIPECQDGINYQNSIAQKLQHKCRLDMLIITHLRNDRLYYFHSVCAISGLDI